MTNNEIIFSFMNLWKKYIRVTHGETISKGLLIEYEKLTLFKDLRESFYDI